MEQNLWDADWHMDTAVMNQTIWAVQDFILDTVMGNENGQNMSLSQKAITQVKKVF